MKSYLCTENYLEHHIIDTFELVSKHPDTLTWENQRARLNRFIQDCRLAHMISESEHDRLLQVLSEYNRRAEKKNLYFPDYSSTGNGSRKPVGKP